MNILANTPSVGCGLKTKLSVQGGVAPYTWSVKPLGAGGSVTSDGLYTAPQNPGTDNIQVVDNVGAIATVQIAVLGVLQIICDIIAREMGLASDQVILWNQTFPVLAKDQRLYVAVGVLTSKPFGNSRQMLADGSEEQVLNMRTQLSIDVMSYGSVARDRKEEVAMALSSVYAEQQMEANSFMIARTTGNFVNISSVEGSGIPYRFNITTTIQHMVIKTKPAAYFDTFDSVAVTEEP